jgi:hypothetical protein
MLVPMLLALALTQNSDAQAAPAEGAGAAPAQTAKAAAARKPAPRHENAWTLDYEPGPMRLYRDPASGKAYWYATFTVINRTGKDRFIAPRWEMLDEQGRVALEGRGVSGDVTAAILRLLHDPQLQECSAIVGDIAQGVENGRTGLVVFPAGPECRRFSLLVAGISSDRDTLKDPKTGQPIVLQKTLRVDYAVPGERKALAGAVPLAEPESGTSNPSWIFR